MSYKTILVHLNEAERAPGLVAYARDLSQAFSAHLVGLYVFPAMPVSPPLRLPFLTDVSARIKAALHAEEQAAKSAFDTGLSGSGVSDEWRAVTTERRDPADIVLEHGRAADLIVASQANPNWDMSDSLDFPDRLALEAGRPVIVVPNVGRWTGTPKRILVGWNGRRESARAVADALPLLVRATKVDVLTVDETAGAREGALPDTEIAAALARHKINVEISRLTPSDFTVGEDLRARALLLGSDLIVMGCYGHSRFREMALGGVTRHLLRDSTVPLLMSH